MAIEKKCRVTEISEKRGGGSTPFSVTFESAVGTFFASHFSPILTIFRNSKTSKFSLRNFQNMNYFN